MSGPRIGTLVKGNEAPDEAIRNIVGHGFESFQIAFSRTLDDVDLGELAHKVEEALGDSGAVISAMGIYGNPLEQDEESNATREGLRILIENAHRFGTNVVGCFTGRVRERPIPESIGRFRDVFGGMALIAQDCGVRIGFENCPMGGTWERGDWNIAHNPAAWEMMFDAVPSEALGLEWEPCHQMCQLIDPMPQIAEWGDRFVHLHGKDARVDEAALRKFGIHGKEWFAWHKFPGFGDSDWKQIISELRDVGFQGSIDIEGWHDAEFQGEREMEGQIAALKHLLDCRDAAGS